MLSVRTRLVAVLLAVALLLAAAPGTALAQQSESDFGGVVVVEAGETLAGDRTIAAGSILIEGTVDGDLEAFAGTVTVGPTGVITGDLSATAGSVVVEGRIQGTVSAAAGSLLVRADATVGGLDVAVGEARIDGTVDGSATVAADRLVLADGAVIAGDLTHDRDTTVERAAGARVDGTTTATDLSDAFAGEFDVAVPAWLGVVYGFLANLVLGAALLLVAPRLAGRVVGVGTRRTVRSGGVGLLVLVAVPVALVAIAITIIGIPFSIAGIVVYGLALWVGFVFGAFLLGSWLLGRADVDNRWLALVGGLLAITLVGLIPFVGGIAELLVLLVGLGAFALALRGRDGSEAEPSPEPAGTGGSAT
jgi:cytoskeletal protein CcmA (bactofilin family)